MDEIYLKKFVLQTDRDIDQLRETLCRIEDKINNLLDMVATEEEEGSHFKMRHIKTLPSDRSYKMLGAPGLKLKVSCRKKTSLPES